jgi:hypothetical protein
VQNRKLSRPPGWRSLDRGWSLVELVLTPAISDSLRRRNRGWAGTCCQNGPAVLFWLASTRRRFRLTMYLRQFEERVKSE